MQRRTKSPTRRSLERALTRAGSALFSFLARHLPLPTLRRVADAAAWLIRKLAPSRQREAIANLRRTFGDRYTEREYRRLVAEVTRGICRTMVELLKSPYLSAEELARLVRLHHLEYLQEALAAGRGVILLTGHYGNWELLGARLARLGFPVSVVARDSAESSTASLINRSREVHGTEVLLREDTRAMLRALRHNRILGILPDQHAAGSGALIVDFLGRPASTAVGVPTLAARTGAVIVPGFCLRRPDGTFDVYLHPPLELAATGDREADLRANTELMNRVIGEQILAHPEQWLWLHRRWKVDGPPSGAPPAPSLPSEPPLA